MRADRFARIRRSRSLYPGVAEHLGPAFPWHTRAGGPRSSQGLCLSVWVPLSGLEARHGIIEAFLQQTFRSREPPLDDGGAAVPPCRDRHWSVAVEVSMAGFSGERGGLTGAVDVVLEAEDAVVCVESKYLGDAAEGLGHCGQFPTACRGFHGPGSDLATATEAPCRLDADGRRLWRPAERFFRPAATAPRDEPASCPLLRHSQLARTLFSAADLAGVRSERQPTREERQSARSFAAIVVAPRATSAVLDRQITAFRTDVLRPEYAGHVALAQYERLADLLTASDDPSAVDVGRCLAARLPEPPDRPPRTQTVREMKAAAARRRSAERRRRRG